MNMKACMILMSFLVPCQVFAGSGGASSALSDLRKVNASETATPWALITPTGDVPPGRVQPYMTLAGNGKVYMMGGSDIEGPGYPIWDVYKLDTVPLTPRWTKLVGWQLATWAESVYPQYIQVWDDQLYVTGLQPVQAVSTGGTCSGFAVFKLDTVAYESWVNITRMSATTPCKANVFSQNDLTIRYYKPDGSSTSTFLVFDIKTLGNMVRVPFCRKYVCSTAAC
jgi:hypothetical protein